MRVETVLISRAASLPENKSAVGKVEQVQGADQLHHLENRSSCARDIDETVEPLAAAAASIDRGAKLFISVNDEQKSTRQYRSD